MIVVAAIGVLSMIAIPSYQNYNKKAIRSQAAQMLLTISNREEQYLLDARQYTNVLGSSGLNIVQDGWTCSGATATTCTNNFYTASVTVVAGTDNTGAGRAVIDNTAVGTAIDTVITNIDTALDKVNGERATLGASPKLEVRRIFWKQIDVMGSSMGTADDFAAMLRLYDQGLRPIIDQAFAFAEASQFPRIETAEGKRCVKAATRLWARKRACRVPERTS